MSHVPAEEVPNILLGHTLRLGIHTFEHIKSVSILPSAKTPLPDTITPKDVHPNQHLLNPASPNSPFANPPRPNHPNHPNLHLKLVPLP